MTALCIASEELGCAAFSITSSQLSILSSVATNNLPRQLQKLSAAGYLTFSSAAGYRTTFAITLKEQQLQDSSRLTMSRVRAALNNYKTPHHETSLKSPPEENTAHPESSQLPNTAHYEPSQLPNTAHLESSFPNTPHHESSLLVGREGGFGG
jgi:hypothetical protein